MPNYWLDSVAGDDGNAGSSFESAWRSLARLLKDPASLEPVRMPPGTKIKLKCGSVSYGQLDIVASGTAEEPIVVEAYGEGPKPIISAGRLIPVNAPWKRQDNGEYSLLVGPGSSIAVLVRTGRQGGHVLLGLGDEGRLAEDSYALAKDAGMTKRRLVYRPPSGTTPDEFSFELSKRNRAISVSGDYVTVSDLDARLGNEPATVFASGAHVVFERCAVRFGRAFGLAVQGPGSIVEDCLVEHNRSTGLYILGAAAVNSTVRSCASRYNGRLGTFGEQGMDRGGIGVQANNALIERNTVHDNGTLSGKKAGGDDAIALSGCSGARVLHNAIFNSARGAIGMSCCSASHGHQFSGNVIARWNLIEGYRRAAIAVKACGSENPGGMAVCHNTIWSDQETASLVGIALRQPSPADVLRSARVFNNLVYLPGNEAADSRGIRLTRERQFKDVQIDHNNVYVGSARNYEAFVGIFETAEKFSEATAVGDDAGYEQHGLNKEPGFVEACARLTRSRGSRWRLGRR